jgi:hypothetical protein
VEAGQISLPNSKAPTSSSYSAHRRVDRGARDTRPMQTRPPLYNCVIPSRLCPEIRPEGGFLRVNPSVLSIPTSMERSPESTDLGDRNAIVHFGLSTGRSRQCSVPVRSRRG